MADYRKKCRGGFTLIELIVVVAIIGILAAVLAPSYIQYVEKARKAEVISEASAVNSAAQIAITAELAANGCTGGGVFKTDSGAEVGRLTNY